MASPSASSSDLALDYHPLAERLQQGDWRQADRLTYELVLRRFGLPTTEWLRTDQLANIPGEDLVTIDRLWSIHSQGHFGLSVQLMLWEFVDQDDLRLGDRLGWRVDQAWLKYQDLQFTIDAPIGHLPYVPRFGGIRWGWGEMFYSQLGRSLNETDGNHIP